jgi:hypothetical protein
VHCCQCCKDHCASERWEKSEFRECTRVLLWCDYHVYSWYLKQFVCSADQHLNMTVHLAYKCLSPSFVLLVIRNRLVTWISGRRCNLDRSPYLMYTLMTKLDKSLYHSESRSSLCCFVAASKGRRSPSSWFPELSPTSASSFSSDSHSHHRTLFVTDCTQNTVKTFAAWHEVYMSQYAFHCPKVFRYLQ